MLASTSKRAINLLTKLHLNPRSFSSGEASPDSAQLRRILSLYSRSPSKLSLALSATSAPPSFSSLHHAFKTLPLDSAFSLFSSLPPSLLSPELVAPLLRRMASPKLLSKALQLLDEIPVSENGSESQKQEMFRCLVDALCKKGNVKEAADLFEHMSDRFTPDLRCFTSLLYGWCKLGKLDEAKFVLVQMRKSGFEPDLVVYNTLLGGFCSAGKMEDGILLLKDMRKKGLEPNVISYTTLIQGFCTKGRMESALNVFVEMSKSKIEADSITYSTLINGFCKLGQIKRGYDLLDEIMQKGFRVDPLAYFSLFIAHEKKDELEECLELLYKMNKSNCKADTSIYNVVIRLSCKLGELNQANILFNEMEINGVIPTLDTYVIIINGLAGQGDPIRASGYFKLMVEKGLFISPQYGVLKTLLNSLIRDEKLELAEEIWDCVIKSPCELNVCTWTIWIHALFSKKYIKEACVYCIEMLDQGFMPQPDTFAKLMKGLKKLYNRGFASEITEKVRVLALERGVSFKAYKRRGVRDLNESLEKKRKGKIGKKKRVSASQGRVNKEKEKEKNLTVNKDDYDDELFDDE
ncbi:hypothetical protein LUZ60_006191 [Juncus effusus]|nr:hypothetical protein LUZ60_006191 [Juncus effusus]